MQGSSFLVLLDLQALAVVKLGFLLNFFSAFLSASVLVCGFMSDCRKHFIF